MLKLLRIENLKEGQVFLPSQVMALAVHTGGESMDVDRLPRVCDPIHQVIGITKVQEADYRC